MEHKPRAFHFNDNSELINYIKLLYSSLDNRFMDQQKKFYLDKPLTKVGKCDTNLSAFAFLFSEIVQYSHQRVSSVPELQDKLSEMGQRIGRSLIDLTFHREKHGKRETRIVNILVFIKSSLWRNLFGKEADGIERAVDFDNTYYLIEKESLVNKFISVPPEKGSFNAAYFSAGIIEGFLRGSLFPAKVTAHSHRGVAYKIEFENKVIDREMHLESVK